ncbi:hypothetical protein [Hymenobacter guriensis]|uniref:G domain-containing protein n=1 Tax=Hymenobacter guriensis TaxID=2793065 RepID=A0ABS0KWW3_9BACT|nr:hypothetical protein [Hymenobacter guriensis]MBG8552335.1 hypothetical protein [Hymenobacter guriensis]
MQSLAQALTKTPTGPLPASTPQHLTLLPGGATPAADRPRPVVPATPYELPISEERLAVISQQAIQAAVRAEQERQWHELKTAQYWWDVANPQEARRLSLADLKRTFLAAAKQHIHPNYATDHGLADVLHKLALYFADDEAFDAAGAGFSRQKGLMLVGTVGVGKSSLMRVWGQINTRQRFGVKSCNAVHAAFTDDGFAGLDVYCQPHTSGVCFDDLGTEALVGKSYGNEASAMATVLLSRYDMFQAGRIPGCATHLTTNLTWDGLKPYGDRVLDRIREMFNIIPFPPTAPSRRA